MILNLKDIPEEFRKSDPLRKYAEGDPIYKIYEHYKNGPKDLEPKKIFPRNIISLDKSTASVSTQLETKL